MCTCEVKCSCDASKKLELHQQLMKLMKFLMVMDDCYQPVRSSLRTRDPLPEVKDTYNVVSKEESHRGVPESFGVTESKHNAISFVAKTFNNNRRQFNNNNNNFTRGSKSFKRNSNSNSGKQSFNANVDVKMSDKPSSSSLSSGFSPKQMQNLLSMINVKPSGSIHANMASRASFFNDPVFTNQVSDSIDHAPYPPRQDIVMTDALHLRLLHCRLEDAVLGRLLYVGNRYNLMFRLGETTRVNRSISLDIARLQLRITQLL
nr:ribonuclease H-like domain-containing protein [Tanacetum cinerariifolium]